MEWKNLNKALEQYAEKTIQLAKLELGTYKPRPVRRTTWNGMTPTSTKITYRKRRAVASGRLQKSVNYEIKMANESTPVVEFSFLPYGKFVEEGRKAGKGVPPAALKKWITQDRKLRYFNRKKNQFESMTPAKLNSMMFTINRSIKAFGIEARPFMKPSERKAMGLYFEAISEAMDKDILDNLTDE